MTKKLFFLLFFVSFVSLLISSNVYADVIVPGEKQLDYCFVLENVNNYPDYQFSADSYLGGKIWSTQIIKENDCLKFYKLATVKISALKIDELNAKPIISDLVIQNPDVVNENNPLDVVKDILTIKSLNNSNLLIEKIKVIYTYSNGSTEEKYYQNQNERPTPSKIVTLLVIFKNLLGFEVIITIIVEFLIIWLFIKGKVLKPLLVSLLINIITVPIANYVYLGNFSLLIIEVLVFVVESLLLTWLLKIKYSKALLISFIANLISFLVGFFLFTLPIIKII